MSEHGTRVVTNPDGTAYELVSFDMAQVADRIGVHHVTTSAFDGENQFLFEVVAPPCDQDEIVASRALTERRAEDRLRGHIRAPGDRDRAGPGAV